MGVSVGLLGNGVVWPVWVRVKGLSVICYILILEYYYLSLIRVSSNKARQARAECVKARVQFV